MSRSTADLLAIKAELTNNPLALSGYLPLTDPANDEANANAMNLERASLQVDRTAIPTSEIFLNIDRDEYAALAAPDREWLNGVSQGGTVNPKAGGEVREGVLQLFGANTETRANLLGILTESANRVEHMFKNGLLETGGTVTPSDVADARNA